MSDFTSSSDATNFRADREIPNDNLSNKVLQAIQELPSSQKDRVPLTKDEAKIAHKALLRKEYASLDFPRTMKTRVDPRIPNQTWALVTFIPSTKAVPDSEGCYGTVKIRGSFPTAEEAENYGLKIITEIDSYSEIAIARVGYEFPLLVNDEMYTAATREVDVRQKIDETYKANFKKKRETESQQMKEIQERREKLMDTTHREEKEKAIEDIDLYIELRVKKANAMMALDESKKTMEAAEEIIRKTNVVLDKIETEHSDYKDEYLERYQRALSSIGSNPGQNPLLPYMIKDDHPSNGFEEIKVTPDPQ